MRNLGRGAAVCIAIGLSVFMAACGGGGGGTVTPIPTTYVLTVNSTNPATGVAITLSAADNNSAKNGTTSFTRTYDAAAPVTLTAPATAGGNNFSSWTGCTSTNGLTCSVTMNSAMTVTANYTTVAPTTYVLTVNSTNPASGVAIGVSPADNNSAANGTTSFTRTYNSGTSVTLTASATSGGNNFSSWTGCTSASTVTCTVALSADTTVSANYTPVVPTPFVLSVKSTNPASGVAITISPMDVNGVTNGTTSFTRTYDSGTSVTLTAPATSGANNLSSWTGCTSVSTVTCTLTMPASNTTVTANYAAPVMITPTVTVTPSASSISTTQALTATVTVSGGSGNPTPTGAVTLTSGSYTSPITPLTGGSAPIDIPAGSLAAGSDTLKATYTPDASSSATYNTAMGSSSAVTVTAPSTITVTTPSTPLAVSDQLLGMNMAVWNDTTFADAVSPFQAAGIKAVRWPGGSTSDDYHWQGTNHDPSSPSMCPTGSYAFPNSTFANFVNNLAVPAGLDIALTANYGSNEACTGGGDPSEAAAWVANALSLGVTVSHMTVGNEEYGHWEEDLHPLQWDPTTYAAAVGNSTSNGYFQQIKAASPNTLVGVDVDAAALYVTPDWDPIVLANSQYDFVEYHYYAQGPGGEGDTYLVHSAARDLTTNINTIKSELTTAGKPDTPIYVGEMGSVSSNPGKQSWSITQGLYAGQVLGEMMNDGVSRATWWIGFGNCNGTGPSNNPANLSALLYGWQDWGAYNVFSDGSADPNCPGAGPLGTSSPTAQAFSLFQNVAVTGEHVLTASVAGNMTDVRAYAATHSGGTATALVLFNLNKTISEPVTVTLSGQSNSTGVTVTTYDKAIYDQTNATNPVWAAPSTTNLGVQSLPLSLTLTPWSMNVVIIK